MSFIYRIIYAPSAYIILYTLYIVQCGVKRGELAMQPYLKALENHFLRNSDFVHHF
jgi:hypothetical protein